MILQKILNTNVIYLSKGNIRIVKKMRFEPKGRSLISLIVNHIMSESTYKFLIVTQYCIHKLVFLK